MQNMDKYKNFTDIAENSKGTANRKYQSYQEQLQAAQNRLAAAWEKLAQDADIAAFITTMTNFATHMVKILPTILKTLTRLIAIWQGYKLPTLVGRFANFTGLGSIVNTGKQIFTPQEGTTFGGRLKGAIQQKNDEILNYGNGQSMRIGLGATNNLLQQILNKVTMIQSGDGLGGVKEFTTDMVQSSEEQAANAAAAASSSYVALDNEELKTAYSEQGAAYEAAATAQDATQYSLEVGQTTAKAGGSAVSNSGMLISGKGGKGSKGLAAVAIAGGISGIVSGVMTTGATHKSSATGETVESSSEASAAMKATSAGINAVGMIGYIWGPIVGMITQTIASMIDGFFTPWLGTLVDGERDIRNARVAEAEKQLTALEIIRDSVTSIEKYSRTTGYTYDEQQQVIKAIQDVKATLADNSDAFAKITQMTGYSRQDIYDLLNNWSDRSDEEHEAFLAAFEAATEEAVGIAEIVAKENEIRTVGEEARANQTIWLYSRTFGKAHGESWDTRHSEGTKKGLDVFKDYAAAEGNADHVYAEYNYTPLHTESAGSTTYQRGSESAHYGFKASSLEGLVNEYRRYVDWLREQVSVIDDVDKKTSYEEAIRQYQTIIDNYDNQIAELNQIYHEANEHLVNAALLQSKISTSSGEQIRLLSANQDQLKRLGKEGIFEAVANQLKATTGLYGYSVESAEGRAMIENIIKQNEDLYAVWTGQIYTLNEAVDSNNTEVLKSFATALGVSVERLIELQGQLGSIKLADVLGSPAETRDKISTLTGLFTSMASSSGMTAENLENIVQKFPELVKYLKDSVSLGGALLQQINAYNELYSRQLLSELVESSAYFEQFKKQLQSVNPAVYNELIDNGSVNFGAATNMQQILDLISGSKSDVMRTYGISEQAYDTLQQLYGEYFNFETNSSLGIEAFDAYVSYWNKVWDRQISNLEEQKTALQEINKQREYENRLIEAKLRLENAQKEKKRVYREGVGWVYEADQGAVQEAQENLEQVEQEQTVSEIEQEIEELNYMKETLDRIADDDELENLKNLWEAFMSDKNLGSIVKSNAFVAQTLKNNWKDITTIKTDGSKLLEEFQGQKKYAFENVFGSSLVEGKFGENDYTMGGGSLWDDLVYARYMMNKYSDNKGSPQYKEWEDRYNEALVAYQTGSSNYQKTYGSAGTEDYKTNASSDQRNYAENVGKSSEAFTGYAIKENSSSAPSYKKLGKHIDTEQLKEWQSSYDNAKKKGKDFHVDRWMPGDAGYDTSTRTIDLSGGHSTSISKDAIDKVHGGSLSSWIDAESNGAIDPGTYMRAYANGDLIGEGVITNNGAQGKGAYLLDAARTGSLGLSGGAALINEVGTEAVITPSGTLTALPSKTGIVPADITRNVWQLGELAPSILRALGYPVNGGSISGASINNSDSLNIGTINMNVSADAGFNPQQFIEAVKAQAALSKNNRR